MQLTGWSVGAYTHTFLSCFCWSCDWHQQQCLQCWDWSLNVLMFVPSPKNSKLPVDDVTFPFNITEKSSSFISWDSPPTTLTEATFHRRFKPSLIHSSSLINFTTQHGIINHGLFMHITSKDAVCSSADTEKQGHTDLKRTAAGHRCTLLLLYVRTDTHTLGNTDTAILYFPKSAGI